MLPAADRKTPGETVATADNMVSPKNVCPKHSLELQFVPGPAVVNRMAVCGDTPPVAYNRQPSA